MFNYKKKYYYNNQYKLYVSIIQYVLIFDIFTQPSWIHVECVLIVNVDNRVGRVEGEMRWREGRRVVRNGTECLSNNMDT